ncbi:transaldolase [Ancylobacter dichloromethanicus]|uniref:Transaldolase n=1 Tax=Ancylobacter dichloromethanicus TaxID=518825 RepID=A0A9W6MZB2_9HYPH|nr:transaldolase [Ancylobacter dichloromethanicus]MBS7552592.1 transaldolase [Ancylobacter dichloromethanicus]GLK71953.1 transaldolase [Ancylobacter dichloromethanicus]
MPSKLDQLRAMTVVVSDTGDIETVRRLKPQDCTTNPTLLLKAAEMPAYAPLVDEVIDWGRRQGGASEAVVAATCDRLALNFGAELSKIVPGRVSTEVDADLSFDTQASLAKARSFIASYEARGVGRDRILIKLASTWEGIRAAEVLQKEGIDCNLTLLFSLAQAAAGADAGAFLISPFVGRILDWHVSAGEGPFTAETDPGVVSVRQIYAYYKKHGIPTVVMGASFRNTGEIEALAGCDRLTIGPSLLDQLAADEGVLERKLDPANTEGAPDRLHLDEKAFRFAMNEDQMATEKLSDGIRHFVKDLRTLRGLVAKRLEGAQAA